MENRCVLSLLWGVLAVFQTFNLLGETSPRQYAVEVSAVVQASPAQIWLQWPADEEALSYSLWRKDKADPQWTEIGELGGDATEFVDVEVEVGRAYEYQITKTTRIGYPGTGYVWAGMEVPPVEYRGRIILLVDAMHSAALKEELKRLVGDFAGDGWEVVRHDVPRSATVPEVRALIQGEYAVDPQNTRAVFLFGHIAVPYSGDYDFDSHLNHKGAWPTDAPYGDVDGTWTDSSVTSTGAERSWNHNVPGDGKYDQSFIASDLELEVGRVDFYNLTCFANKTPARNEEDLLRQYLQKDHSFRHAHWELPRRGLVCDNFGEASGEALASTGWRSFAPFFGATNTVQVGWGEYFPTLMEEGYLCSYGTGGGGWYTCAGVGSSDDFAVNDIKSVFAFFFGSYFGDWDNESNFLRAALGSTSHTLVTGWAGRPHWFLHHMGLGETIGYSLRLTQNNVEGGLYGPQRHGVRRITTTLLGDPTLRLHPVPPATNVDAQEAAPGISLAWNASPDPGVEGYFIYRAPAPLGPFQRISGDAPVTGTTFSDESGNASFTYMVRALKLEGSASGTYYNLSQGAFGKAISYSIVPVAPGALRATEVTGSTAILEWEDRSDNEHGFTVYRQGPEDTGYVAVADLGEGAVSYEDSGLSPGTAYEYVVAAYNPAGESPQSQAVAVTTKPPSSASFVQEDRTTSGSWKGVYGEEGFDIIRDGSAYPAYVSAATSNLNGWVWNWNTEELRALEQVSASSRIAGCYYTGAGQLSLMFEDDEVHRVGLYFLDWDNAGRRQVVEIVDSDTGTVLDSRIVEAFGQGAYLFWDLQGRIQVRLTPIKGNAVVSGIFFDSAIPSAALPVFDPPAGEYEEMVEVSISSETEGSTIYYTVDGSTPTTASQVYAGPLTFTNTTTLKAIAAAEGLKQSAPATAKYTVLAPWAPPSSTVQFQGADLDTGGDWKGVYGGEGFLTISDAQSIPEYVTLAATRNASWIWTDSTADTRALQRANVSGRMASCWYEREYFEIELNFLDDELHQVSFYCLDWDQAGRSQRVEIVDFDTRQVIHGVDISGFAAGAYLTYKIQGHVIARFTKIASHNAVVSGIFFDAATPSAAPPLISPASGSYDESVEVTITAENSEAAIYYTLDGTKPTVDSTSYEGPIVLTNSATVKAIAVEEGLNPSAVATAEYTVIPPWAPPSATVEFLGADTETQGTWKGVYGADGQAIASDAQSIPGYARVNVTGKSDWIWSYSTADVRALQRMNLETRMASCWYSPGSFEVEIELSDGVAHELALYCMDWDRAGREQRVEVIDFDTKQVLHSIDLAGFDEGAYLRYLVEGHVIFRFTRLQSHNAVVMGVFFDTPGE